MNKGLLGTAAEFNRFASSLSEKPSGYAKLKAMTAPFMLRRLKTDKSIISDLPEKLEMTDYVTLSKKAPYVSVAEHKAKAKKYIEAERKKGVVFCPVELEGRTIAKSWWGRAWCGNLEKYADYASRLERGRKYVRANCVLDLHIEPGLVTALVQGSGKKPYSVKVRIDELTEEQYQTIVEKCASKIQNRENLVNGNFPDDLKTLFTEKGAGLFPSMAKIHFNCSCPDWADMCKHVVAVLYGGGSRFDKDSLLFFTLRGVDTDRLIGKAINDRIEHMIENAENQSARIMPDNECAALFGL